MVYQNDAEMIFPSRVIPLLRNLRGQEWQQLIDLVLTAGDGSVEQQAFTLMMIRLSGCLTCHADSYRAMRGCTLCAQQTVARYKGDDAELLVIFEEAKADIENWHQTGEVPEKERPPQEDD